MAWFSRFVVSAPIQLTCTRTIAQWHRDPHAHVLRVVFSPVAIYLLYGWLGPSAFVSLAVVLLLMPIKFFIFQYVRPPQSTSCGAAPLRLLNASVYAGHLTPMKRRSWSTKTSESGS